MGLGASASKLELDIQLHACHEGFDGLVKLELINKIFIVFRSISMYYIKIRGVRYV